MVSPVPVTLDGQPHTVTIPMEEIAFTMSPQDALTLQPVGSATSYENVTSVGLLNVSAIQLALPTVATDAGPTST